MRAWRSSGSLKEIYTAEANDLGRLWNSRGTQVAAPYLMPVEVTNALHQRAARGESTLEAATQRMDSLLSSGLKLHQPPHLYSRALELAGQLRQGAAYDAHYLALAETLGCELCGPPTRDSTGLPVRPLGVSAG